MDYDLTGKIALVTGVSRHRGIGAAIVQALADAGCDVFTTYYRPYDAAHALPGGPGEADAILDGVRRAGRRAAGMEADLGEPPTPSSVFDRAEEALGPVDILVNNATHSGDVDAAGVTADALDAHYRVNVRGTLLLCAEFLRRHDGRPGGRIVSLTSGQGLTPMPTDLVYAATKGAIDAFTMSLAPAAAAKGITVNAVDPGPTDTGWMSDALRQSIADQTPLGRVGQPEDAARLICFLASTQAQWITGQILRSRGGF